MNDKNEIEVLNEDYSLIEGNFGQEHKKMIDLINQNLPAMSKTTKNFNKTQSQFMDNMLTVSHPTPIRNVRQILAEVNKSMMALNEAEYSLEEKKILIKKLKYEVGMGIDLETDKKLNEFDEALKKNEIRKLESSIKQTMGYVSGAIRKITNYANQYNSILKTIGKEELTEADFEAEEIEYHIKKAFEQALCAARSHGGAIDEGNQIYLTQIGINGTLAQQEVTGYLMMEQKMIKDFVEKKEGARLPNHADQLKFLNDMYLKYKECSEEYSEKKGMSTKTDLALFGGENNENTEI